MTIHSISSGDADVSRTHISVFTLPTRTFTGGLRFTWLDYVGEEARRKAASIHSPSASVSYLATEALMRALAAPRLGISGRSARTITVDRSCRLCTSGKPHGKPRIAGVNFNMSQVPSLAAGGFCAQQQVVLGIDLEAVQASLFPGFARVALTVDERAAYESLPPGQQQAAGVAIWTAKEAVLKATGHGLSVSPQTVQIECDDATLAMVSALCEPANPLDAPGRQDRPCEHELSVSPRVSVRAKLTLPEDSDTSTKETPAGGEDAGKHQTPKTHDISDENAHEGSERSFFITWSVLTLSPTAHPTADTAGRAAHPERFLLAVATEDTVPVVDVHSVATPLDVKRLLEPPATAY
mgnify:FL=1